MRRWQRNALIALALVVATCAYGARATWVGAMHAAACHAIALEVASGRGEFESDAQLIAHLIEASVIHGRIRTDGSPTDLNGNPYRVEREGALVTVSVQPGLWSPFSFEWSASEP